jgi:hypothetical protein
MKKLCCLIVVALVALAAAPITAPAAPVVVTGERHEREFEEFVFGPFEHERHAEEEAHHLRERGFHTEVYHVRHLGWQVKAWRRE